MAVTDPRESEAAGLWLAEGLPIGDGSEPGLGRAVRAVDGVLADVGHGYLKDGDVRGEVGGRGRSKEESRKRLV